MVVVALYVMTAHAQPLYAHPTTNLPVLFSWRNSRHFFLTETYIFGRKNTGDSESNILQGNQVI